MSFSNSDCQAFDTLYVIFRKIIRGDMKACCVRQVRFESLKTSEVEKIPGDQITANDHSEAICCYAMIGVVSGSGFLPGKT